MNVVRRRRPRAAVCATTARCHAPNAPTQPVCALPNRLACGPALVLCDTALFAIAVAPFDTARQAQHTVRAAHHGGTLPTLVRTFRLPRLIARTVSCRRSDRTICLHGDLLATVARTGIDPSYLFQARARLAAFAPRP